MQRAALCFGSLIVGQLKRLIPVRWKHALKQSLLQAMEKDIRDWIREEPPNIEWMRRDGVVMRQAILQELYTPWQRYSSFDPQFLAPSARGKDLEGQRFPIPPDEILMGYQGDIDFYLDKGEETAKIIRETLSRVGAPLKPGAVILDWGCASGRVLRHFAEEATAGAFWGVDQHARCIMWAKEFMSPPFNFLTGSALPYLPFESNTFDLIYGISVFTHLEHLVDEWLMELRRLLKPGGHCLMTVHTEASIERFRMEFWPPWLDRNVDIRALMSTDVSVLPNHGDWECTYVFYREEYLRREWGRYMNVVEVLPAAVPYCQTAVLLRK